MLKQHAVQCLDQVSMVQAVKRFVSGFVLEPVVMRPTHTLADLDKLRAATGITTASRLKHDAGTTPAIRYATWIEEYTIQV